jgi:hypothetical protein
MYASYKRYVLAELPKKDLSRSVCSTLTLGYHVCTILNIYYFQEVIHLEMRTEVGDLFTDFAYIRDSRTPNKASWKMWRLLFALIGNYQITNRYAHDVLRDVKQLDQIVGQKVKCLIRDSEGFKVERDLAGQFYLVDGPSGSRIEGGPWTSYNEAKQAGGKLGLKQSCLTVGRWDSVG